MILDFRLQILDWENKNLEAQKESFRMWFNRKL
jgi:hypothetical protein